MGYTRGVSISEGGKFCQEIVQEQLLIPGGTYLGPVLQWDCETFYVDQKYIFVINRPGVAGAVLQTASSLIK